MDDKVAKTTRSRERFNAGRTQQLRRFQAKKTTSASVWSENDQDIKSDFGDVTMSSIGPGSPERRASTRADSLLPPPSPISSLPPTLEHDDQTTDVPNVALRKRSTSPNIRKLAGSKSLTPSPGLVVSPAPSSGTPQEEALINDLKDKIEILEREKAELLANLSDLEAKISNYTAPEEINHLQAERERMDSVVRELESDCQRYREEARTRSERTEALENELQDTKESLASLNDSYHALETQLAETNQRLEALQAQYDAVYLNLQSLKTSKPTTAGDPLELQQLRERLELLEAENDDIINKNNDWDEYLQSIQNAHEEERAEIDEKYKSLAEDLIVERDERDALERMRDELAAEVDQLNEALEKTRNSTELELQSLEAENSNLARELEVSQSERRRLEDVVDQLEVSQSSEHSQLQSRIEELQTLLDDLRQSNTQLKSEIEQEQLEKSRLQNELQAAQDAQTTSKTQYEDLSQQILNLSAQLAEAKEEATQNGEANNTSLEKLGTASQLLANLQRENDDLTNTQDGLRNERDELLQRLEANDQEIRDIQQKLVSTESELDGLHKSTRDESEKLQTLQSDYDSLERTNADIETRLKKISSEKDDLEIQLEYAQSSLDEAQSGSSQELESLRQSYDRIQLDYNDLRANYEEIYASRNGFQTENADLLSSFQIREQDLQEQLDKLNQEYEVVYYNNGVFEDRIKDLEELVAQSESSNQALAQHLADLAEKEKELQEIKSSYAVLESSSKQERDEQTRHAEDLRNTLANMEAQMQNLQNTLDESEARADSDTVMIGQLGSQAQEQTVRIKELEVELGVANSSLRRQENKVHDLERQLERQTSDTQESLSVGIEQIQALEIKISTLTTQKESLETSLKNQISQLEDQLKRTESIANLEKSQTEQLNEDILQLRHLLGQERAESDSILMEKKKQISELTEKNRQLYLEVQTTKESGGERDQVVEATRRELIAIQSKNSELSVQKEELSTALEEVKRNLTTLMDTHAATSRQLSETSVALEKKGVSLATAKVNERTLKRQIQDLNQKVKDVEASTSSTDTVREEHNAQITALNAKLVQIARERDYKQSELEAADREVIEVKQMVVSLTIEKEDALLKIREANSKVNGIEKTVKHMQSSLQQSEEEIAELQGTVQEKNSKLLELEQRLRKDTESASMLALDQGSALQIAQTKTNELQKELDSTRAIASSREQAISTLEESIKNIKSELSELSNQYRGSLHQISTLSEDLGTKVTEIDSLKHLLEDQQELKEETVEELREMVKARDAELDTLRNAPSHLSAFKAVSDSGANIDQDFVNAIHNQSELELSEAKAKIRALEKRAWAAEDSNYKLEKNNGVLKDQVESMLISLEMERDRTRRKERELESLRVGVPFAITPGATVPTFSEQQTQLSETVKVNDSYFPSETATEELPNEVVENIEVPSIDSLNSKQIQSGTLPEDRFDYSPSLKTTLQPNLPLHEHLSPLNSHENFQHDHEKHLYHNHNHEHSDPLHVQHDQQDTQVHDRDHGHDHSSSGNAHDHDHHSHEGAYQHPDHDHKHEHNHDHDHDHDHDHTHTGESSASHYESRHVVEPNPFKRSSPPPRAPRSPTHPMPFPKAASTPVLSTLAPSLQKTRRESLQALQDRLEDEGYDVYGDLLNAYREHLNLPTQQGGRGVVMSNDLVWCSQCKGDLFVL